MPENPAAAPDTPPPFIVPDSPELSARLAQIEQAQARIIALKAIRPDLWPTIQSKLRILWTADSNAIEGSSLSRADTAFFLLEGLTVEGKPLKDFLDARNHAEAIDLVADIIQDRLAITPGILKELNAILLKGVEWTPAVDAKGRLVRKAARPGAYKERPNHVLQIDGSLHHYLDPIHVPAAVECLCTWVAHAEQSHSPHPVIAAALAHHEFVRIHPFDDGNGRGARLLMNFVLMRAEYLPAVIPVERRRAYIAALQSANRGDFAPFCLFIADNLLETQVMIAQDLDGTAGSTSPP